MTVEATPEAPPYVDGTKLMRIWRMVSLMLDELRALDLDSDFRTDLLRVQRRAVEEVEATVPAELRVEFEHLSTELPAEATRDELRVVQAQLVGWLEGVLQGLQIAVRIQAPAEGHDHEHQAAPDDGSLAGDP